MENVAIIDMGSARTKVAIMQNIDHVVLRLKDETGLSDHVNDKKELDTSYLTYNVLPKLSEYVDQAKASGCKRLLTIGTHIFRNVSNSSEVKELIETQVGKLNVIEGWLEGAIFYSWMTELKGENDLLVIDIGGGSVQIATNSSQSGILSLPTGTFSLEKEFQNSKEFATQNEISRMQDYVKSQLDSKINTNSYRPRIAIMGSNCMQEFIASSLNHMHEKGLRKNISDGSEIDLEDAIAIFDEIKCKDYNSLAQYYPKNKFFMYGADKALLNLIEICKYYRISKIQPTNESVSSALLSLLSRHPEKLLEFGIKYHPIS